MMEDNTVYLLLPLEKKEMGYLCYFIPLCKKILENNYKIKIIHDLNNLNSNENKVITVCVSLQYDIFKEKCNFNIYNMLDDKIEFYQFLKNNNSLLTNIKLINTYDKNYNGINLNKEFIVKHHKGYGTINNEIITGNIYDLIEKYSETHQIQDVLNTKYIYGLSFCCFDGEIYGIFTYKIYKNLSLLSYLVDEEFEMSNFIDNKTIQKFTKDIIKKLNYNGIIELEFLIDTNDDIYILECNPRMSSCIFWDEYFDNVIYPLINKTKNTNEKFNKIKKCPNNVTKTINDVGSIIKYKAIDWLRHI